MAKAQGTSFIDAHVEKIVLAVCLLILIFAVIHYGVSTPRRLEVVNIRGQVKMVPPNEVDKNLLAAARRVDSVIKRVKRETPPERRDLAQLKQLQKKTLPGEKTALDYCSPERQGIVYHGASQDEPGSKPTLEQISATMPSPSKPLQWFGEELIGQEDEQGKVKFSEKPVWRAAVSYPWAKLQRAWENSLKHTIIIPRLVAVRYEVQFQEKQPNGQWKTVDDIKLLRQSDETGQNIQAPEIPDFTGTNAQEVRKACENYYAEWMIDQLQPTYEQIWTPQGQADWLEHMPVKDILKGFPEETQTGSNTRSEKKRTTPTRTLRLRSQAGVPTKAMPGMMPPTIPTAFRGASRGQSPQARHRADRQVGKALALPSPQQQIDAGVVLAWFHTDSIKYGREYRCRFRMVFVNPLLTHSQNVKKDRPQDATIKYVKTKWSPWSDTVAIYRELEFFLTGAYPAKRWVSLTVFGKTLGQRVSMQFSKISVGEEIGRPEKITVISPATNELEKTTIDFNTGAIPIELTFNKRIVTFTGQIRPSGVEMVYLDAKGKLHSRMLHLDKSSSRYRQLLKEAKETATKVKELIDAERGIEPQRKKSKKYRRQTRPTGQPIPGGMMPGGMMPGMIPGAMPTGRKSTRRR
jgi:hypothetical protein